MTDISVDGLKIAIAGGGGGGYYYSSGCTGSGGNAGLTGTSGSGSSCACTYVGGGGASGLGGGTCKGGPLISKIMPYFRVLIKILFPKL